MMQVAISTLELNFLLSNYGTFLQHYCLRNVLKSLGYEPFRLSHDPSACRRYDCAFMLFMAMGRFVKRILRRDSDNFSWLMETLSEVRKVHWFKSAYRKHIGHLLEFPASTKIIGLMGSDQIMNGAANVWFESLPKDCGRLVYAGSGDWKSMADDERVKEQLRRNLPAFCAVSVRERAGISLCQKYVNPDVKVAHVLDPVLLSDWSDVAALADEQEVFSLGGGGILLCYLVNIREKEQLQLRALEDLAMELNCSLKILCIQGGFHYVPRKYRVSLSPQCFLAAFRDAAYVVTNSFHGGVVALRYQKRFAVVRQKDLPGCDQNVRQLEFLETFGLSRLFCERVQDAKRALATSIDYKRVNARLSELRKDSLEWLSQALKKATQKSW